MRSFAAATTVTAQPSVVLEWLSDPDACAEWSPLPCVVERLAGGHFATGACARISGRLANQAIAFGVYVREASQERFALRADGPFGIEVNYDLLPEASGGTRVEATVAIGRPQGLQGRAMATAAGALLAAGLLDQALERLAMCAERGFELRAFPAPARVEAPVARRPVLVAA